VYILPYKQGLCKRFLMVERKIYDKQKSPPLMRWG
jgi:hypothetical protein